MNVISKMFCAFAVETNFLCAILNSTGDRVSDIFVCSDRYFTVFLHVVLSIAVSTSLYSMS